MLSLTIHLTHQKFHITQASSSMKTIPNIFNTGHRRAHNTIPKTNTAPFIPLNFLKGFYNYIPIPEYIEVVTE